MLENSKDPRFELIYDINFDKSRVEFSSSPIVILCGGYLSKNLSPLSSQNPPISLRDALNRHYLPSKFELFCPEQITSWLHHGMFKDLMTFETELASLCTLTVILLESEGSFVELGAFSQIPELNTKIIAIQSSNFAQDNSFINLGILSYLKQKNKKSVKNYPWNIKPIEIDIEVVNDIIVDIQDYLNDLPKSEKLDIHKNSHIMVLIYEFINYFRALKEKEIYEFLSLINVDIKIDEIKRKLFLLEEFEIIKKVHYSESFYMLDKENYHRINLSLISKKKFDLDRIQIECTKFYTENIRYKNWDRAIKQGLKK